MKYTNYEERIGEEKNIYKQVDLLREAMAEVSVDISKLTTKWQADMPILLAALRSSLPQIERIAGETGVRAANALGEITGCMSFSTPLT